MLYYRTPMFPDPAFDFPYNCFFVKRDYKLYNDICAHVSLRKQTIDLSLQRTSAKISDFQTTPQSGCVRISKTTPSSDVSSNQMHFAYTRNFEERNDGARKIGRWLGQLGRPCPDFPSPIFTHYFFPTIIFTYFWFYTSK